MITTILQVVGLLAGSILILFGIILHKSLRRYSKVTKPETCASNNETHLTNSGIYIEHGMVSAADGKSVVPQSKISKSFYETLI